MKSRITKPLVPTPTTRAEVEALVGDIRLLQIQRMSIQADREARVQALDDKFSRVLVPLDDQLEVKIAQVQAWAEANPVEFEKKKSIEFTHGTIGFRTGTPKLVLLSRAWNWKKALAAVQQFLPAFLRSVPEIDKESIIAQRDDETLKWALPRCGLKVDQGESFFVDPKIEDVNTTVKKEAA
ncbi:MAG TPA: host-nuclease inhibitor Gam family protein [Verrucomicrobiae bacterium]|nr:host-nuclease inhibitor Gam family protein [Verrucomicrobiae bacterium]